MKFILGMIISRRRSQATQFRHAAHVTFDWRGQNSMLSVDMTEFHCRTNPRKYSISHTLKYERMVR